MASACGYPLSEARYHSNCRVSSGDKIVAVCSGLWLVATSRYVTGWPCSQRSK